MDQKNVLILPPWGESTPDTLGQLPGCRFFSPQIGEDYTPYLADAQVIIAYLGDAIFKIPTE